MEYQQEQAIEILERTPSVIRALVGDLGEHWTHSNYGEESFSPFDVVGHLIHGERTDWIPRARMILEHGETRPFEPFDRYAMYEDSRGRTMAELVNTFEQLRRENLEQLASLQLDDDRYALRGTHPALGPVTMSNLLATWVAHDLNHIAQIAKAMAFQYREAVGPWQAYLSILKPPQPA